MYHHIPIELSSSNTDNEMIFDWYDISNMDKNKDYKAISGSLVSIYKHSLEIGNDLFETFCSKHTKMITEVSNKLDMEIDEAIALNILKMLPDQGHKETSVWALLESRWKISSYGKFPSREFS